MELKTYEHIKNNLNKLTIDSENGIVTTLKGTTGYTNKKGRRTIKIAGKQVYRYQIIAVNNFGELCIGYEINHIDGDCSNDKVSNLEVLTRDGNLEHQRVNKLFRKQDTTSVDMFSLDDKYIRSYDSIADASRDIGLPDYTGISHCINGKQKTCAGYKWSKKE